MSLPCVVLHPKLPPGVADFVRGTPGLSIQAPADDDGVAFGPRWGAIFRDNLAAFQGRGKLRNAVAGPGAAR